VSDASALVVRSWLRAHATTASTLESVIQAQPRRTDVATPQPPAEPPVRAGDALAQGVVPPKQNMFHKLLANAKQNDSD
jgi:hypothetical protein